MKRLHDFVPVGVVVVVFNDHFVDHQLELAGQPCEKGLRSRLGTHVDGDSLNLG